ncbi:MAG: DNA-primase RepB domain-containing protein [Terracidiphilus sp.]
MVAAPKSLGRNIYVRPQGEHNLSLVDDLTLANVTAMKKAGFGPAVVVETSPGNYQAWLKHPEQLGKDLSTAAARALAEKFGGDRGAADWRHFGRLSGFTNRKPGHLDPATGWYPFVRLIEAGGQVYPQGEQFLALVRQTLERQRFEQESLRQQFDKSNIFRVHGLKSIETFRANLRYNGDGTRVDLAYAVYALSQGVPASEVQAAIRSRDLSHKGNERRQNEYVERTIKKAFATLERGR